MKNTSISMRPVWARSLGTILASITFLLAAAAEVGAYTAERRSASYMNICDNAKAPTKKANYAGYLITNNGGAQADVWVVVTNFSGGVVTLADYDDGIFHLGAMGAGESKMVYFLLKASGATASAQTHDLQVYNGAISGSPAFTQTFTLNSVVEEQPANANKPLVVVSTPSPAYVGGTVTVTFTGDTGTLGGIQDLLYTAASEVGWRADLFHLYDAQITFTGGNNTNIDNRLYFTLPTKATSAYSAVYKFRILDRPPPSPPPRWPSSAAASTS